MKKIFTTAYKHIRRTPYQALSAILVLTLTFFIASVYFLVMVGSEKILRHFETRPQVTVFFSDEADESQVQNIQETLSGLEGVAGTTYISKEEALEIYQQQNQDDPLLLEMVTADILPASLEVSATDVRYLPQIAESVATQAGVEEVVFQEDIINALTAWTRAVRVSGVALLGFLGLTSILIIMIIISLKISSRKIEIGILNLVGATNWYVIGPFLIEGMVYGIFGAFFGWLMTYVLLLYATPFLISFLGDIPLLPVSFLSMLLVLAGMVITGSFIGGLASILASKRFLR